MGRKAIHIDPSLLTAAARAHTSLTACARVLAALERGGRTFGELMNDTGLDWHLLVETVNRLMVNGRVVAREVCGTRRHFSAGAEVNV